MYIGQQHPITVYRIVFCVCVFMVWVSLSAPVTISLIGFYHIKIFTLIIVTIIGIFMTINYCLT